MERSRARSGEDIWPTEEQEWLLQTALLDRDAALEAWERWRARVDLRSRLDRGTFRLLPRVYRRLQEFGIADACMEDLARIYRASESENRRLFRVASSALTALQNAGLDTMLLKGAPLALCYYGDPGERPMADVDLAVPTARAEAAAKILCEAGFVPQTPVSRDVVRFLHSVPFRDPQGKTLDFHWHVLFESSTVGLDDDFWKAAKRIDFERSTTRILCASDQLFHVVVHGMKWSRVPAIRWIADAILIHQKAGSDVDWNRVQRLAEERKVVLRLGKALHYLRERMGLILPDGVLERLDRLPVSRLEYAEASLRLKSRHKVVRWPSGPLAFVFVDYWRLRGGAVHPLAALRYLYFRLRLKSARGFRSPRDA